MFILEFIAAWYFVVLPVLVVLAAWADGTDHYYTAAFLSGLAAVGAVYFNIISAPLLASIYLPLGIVWSFWRFKRFVKDKVAFALKHGIGKSETAEKVKINNNKDLVTSWIISWPASLISNVVGDTVTAIKEFAVTRLGNIYNSIMDSELKEFDKQ